MPNTTQLFMSLRHEDLSLGARLKAAIEELSDHTIRIKNFEQIPGSDDWRDWIEDNIRDCDGLIFLYTDDTASWRWCLYEIGMFRGVHPKHDPKKYAPVICIQTPEVQEKPDSLADIQWFTANAKGLEDLFDQLVFSNEIIKEHEISSTISRYRDKFGDHLKILLQKFTPPSETEYLVPRLSLILADRVDDPNLPGSGDNPESTSIELYSINEIRLKGDMALEALQITDSDCRWETLYQALKHTHNHQWLDALETMIKDLRDGSRNQLTLHTLPLFQISDTREIFVPVVTSYETFRRSSIDGNPEDPADKWSKIFVTLVPNRLTGGLNDLRDIFDTSVAQIYSPASVVQIRWSGRSEGGYKIEDMVGEPVVCRCNSGFADIFNFKSGDPGRTSGDILLTQRFLADRLKKYNFVKNEHLGLLMDDQQRIFNELILQDAPAKAKVPLQLNENHPMYPNKVFLPDMLLTQIIGDRSAYHKMLMLVTYVEDFLPIPD